MATSRVSQPPFERDARVYLLVEEARLRCEVLQAAEEAEAKRRELRRLHRDVGLAGLYISTTMPSELRRRLLARVHARHDRLSGNRAGAARGLHRVLKRATRELSRAIVSGGAAEHRELAQLHLLRATEFVGPAPSPLPVHLFRQRHPA
jgi:hypothetical protein